MRNTFHFNKSKSCSEQVCVCARVCVCVWSLCVCGCLFACGVWPRTKHAVAQQTLSHSAGKSKLHCKHTSLAGNSTPPRLIADGDSIDTRTCQEKDCDIQLRLLVDNFYWRRAEKNECAKRQQMSCSANTQLRQRTAHLRV